MWQVFTLYLVYILTGILENIMINGWWIFSDYNLVHVDLLNIILMDAWGSGGFIGNGDKVPVRVVNTR